jgi:CRISPR-associated endonuclease/helicase Cas3
VTFEEFFVAAWGFDPFPWQKRLAALAMCGEWPGSIGLPTAAGKTALIDIAIYALAMGAPNAARRLFFVVDRRVIVDEAAERAETLAEKLRGAPAGSVLGVIATRLCELSGGHDPLVTATLRGGIPRDDTWTRSPLQPMVICSTVDQVGSSLLFRAYGSSEYSWPIRAALVAYDSLLILDEAHTSQPFAETLERIRHYRRWAEQPLPGSFTVVEMSATPRTGEVFSEEGDDRSHPVLSSRWIAEKRARLQSVDPREGEEAERGGFSALIEALAKEARSFRDRGAKVIGVIANRVATARRIHTDLAGDPSSDAILLTGRARAYDRDVLWTKWQPSIKLGRERAPEKPVFVVATQCIEVGANIDFDALVTEAASLDALEQRFGRLNRQGRPEISHAVIVGQKDQTKKKYVDTVYGAALAASWSWLEAHRTKLEETIAVPAEGKKKPKTKKIKHEFVAMGVLELRRALAETRDREVLAMPHTHAPVLMPAHVDLLCQTSPEPVHVPEPALFLHGPVTGPADAEVIWRGDLPNSQPSDRDLWASIVAICPPSAAEVIALPIWEVRRWLSSSAESDLSDIEGADQQESFSRRDSRAVLCWRGPDESRVLESAEQVRPGMTVVVPAEYGGCDEWGWNPAHREVVADVGDVVKSALRRPILRLSPDLARQFSYEDLARQLRGIDSVMDAREILRHYSTVWRDTWTGRVAEMLARSRSLKLINSPDTESEATWAVSGRGVFDQGESRSSYTVEVPLAEHLAGCEERARVFSRGLPDRLRHTVSRAAGLHDVGKADRRFQAWLRGGNPLKPKDLLAKSNQAGRNSVDVERARQIAGYPKGCRHELMSVALLAGRFTGEESVDEELLLHLVGSHHGRCRPFAPVVDDLEPVDVSFNGWGTKSDHRLDRAGSGITERFWRLTRRYGWYGLAYLEAIVRLADHRQSEAEEDREEQRGG